MTKVNVNEIKTNFTDLLTQLKKTGESIVIEDNDQAFATVINYEEWKRLKELEKQIIMEKEGKKSAQKTPKKRPPLFGIDKDLISISDDFDEPLEDFKKYM